jgi:hypothetical protein
MAQIMADPSPACALDLTQVTNRGIATGFPAANVNRVALRPPALPYLPELMGFWVGR